MEIRGHGRSIDLAKLLLGVQETERSSEPRGRSSAFDGDRIQISHQAKEIQRIKALAQEPDKARAERIERLRRTIDAGTYTVNGRAVGDALIRYVLTDSVL
jgi:negative regulator of flagellin synthesis FlgM